MGQVSVLTRRPQKGRGQRAPEASGASFWRLGKRAPRVVSRLFCGDMSSPSQDEFFMQRALSLAAGTTSLASPNPQVGCVLVRDGLILGEGAHIYDNYDHA